MFAVATAIGVVCAAGFELSDRCHLSGIIGAAALVAAWLALTLLGSLVCGYVRPARAWRWGATVMGVQPVYLVVRSIGQLADPANSYDAVRALVALSMVAAVLSPLAMLASHLGSHLRSRQHSMQDGAL